MTATDEMAMNGVTCPECSMKFVERAHRESLQERMLSFVYVYPFRCQLCGCRFKSLQWSVRYVKIVEDHRTYQRWPVSFPVRFSNERVQGDGSVSDLSIAGCAFSTTASLTLGTIMSLRLCTSSAGAPIAVDASVVRHVQRNRIGIEFLQLKKIERDRLREFIRGLILEQDWNAANINREPVPAAHDAGPKRRQDSTRSG